MTTLELRGAFARRARRLRLGVVAPEFPPFCGGMSTLAWGLSAALARRARIVVLTPAERGLAQGARFEQRAILTGSFRRDLRALQDTDVDAWLAMNGGLIPLARHLHRRTFVYLHGNDFLNPWLPYGSWWMEGLRKPYMATVRRAVRRRALRRGAGALAHVFTNSRTTADLAAGALGVERHAITVCPPGVDDEFFQDHEPQDGALRLLTVTRLTRFTARKNVDGVLRAIASLRDQVPIRYDVVGDGDDLPRLQALAGELGLGDAVTFRGRLAAGELREAYRKADLFVLASKSSRYDVEGFGIVYLEASAAGVPVICSSEGGAVDAVEHGRNGLVIPGSSPEHIAEGIREFLRRRATFTPHNVRSFAEGFRWDAVSQRLYGRITALLAAGGDGDGPAADCATSEAATATGGMARC